MTDTAAGALLLLGFVLMAAWVIRGQIRSFRAWMGKTFPGPSLGKSNLDVQTNFAAPMRAPARGKLVQTSEILAAAAPWWRLLAGLGGGLVLAAEMAVHGAGAWSWLGLILGAAGGWTWQSGRDWRAWGAVARARASLGYASAHWQEASDHAKLGDTRFRMGKVDPAGHGWSARLHLRGATLDTAQQHIAELEAGLHLPHGSVRLSRGERAHLAALSVTLSDPLKRVSAWTGPSAHRVSEPFLLGVDERGAQVSMCLAGQRMIVAGQSGFGKSVALNLLIAQYAHCEDVALLGVDLKWGLELKAWRPVMVDLARNEGEATELLQGLTRVMQAHGELMERSASNLKTWRPTKHDPALVVVIDEAAELSSAQMAMLARIFTQGRALGVWPVVCTQHPSKEVLGTFAGVIRGQGGAVWSFQLQRSTDVNVVFGPGMLSDGWDAHRLGHIKGKSLLYAPPEFDAPRPFRSIWIDDASIPAMAAERAPHMARLDPESELAFLGTEEEVAGEGGDRDERLIDALVRGDGPTDAIKRAGLRRSTGMARIKFLVETGRLVREDRGRYVVPATQPQPEPQRLELISGGGAL